MGKEHFGPTFFIALIVIVGGLVLIYLGHDGEIKALVGMAVGFYFGQKVPTATQI